MLFEPRIYVNLISKEAEAILTRRWTGLGLDEVSVLALRVSIEQLPTPMGWAFDE